MNPKTTERVGGHVTATALSDRVASLGIDLLLAQDSGEYLRIAQHLRSLADQVERHAGRVMEQEKA